MAKDFLGNTMKVGDWLVIARASGSASASLYTAQVLQFVITPRKKWWGMSQENESGELYYIEEKVQIKPHQGSRQTLEAPALSRRAYIVTGTTLPADRRK